MDSLSSAYALAPVPELVNLSMVDTIPDDIEQRGDIDYLVPLVRPGAFVLSDPGAEPEFYSDHALATVSKPRGADADTLLTRINEVTVCCEYTFASAKRSLSPSGSAGSRKRKRADEPCCFYSTDNAAARVQAAGVSDYTLSVADDEYGNDDGGESGADDDAVHHLHRSGSCVSSSSHATDSRSRSTTRKDQVDEEYIRELLARKPKDLTDEEQTIRKRAKNRQSAAAARIRRLARTAKLETVSARAEQRTQTLAERASAVCAENAAMERTLRELGYWWNPDTWCAVPMAAASDFDGAESDGWCVQRPLKVARLA